MTGYCRDCRFYTKRGLTGPGCARATVHEIDPVTGYAWQRMPDCWRERSFDRDGGFFGLFGKLQCGPSGRFFEPPK